MCTNNANRIKALYIEHIVSTMGTDVIIGNEVMYGTSGKVADLILLYKGNTYAIEIKSDADSLSRIDGQLLEYRKQFNYVIVVCGPKYADILARSLPNGIGLCKILEDETVMDLRRPKKNTKLEKAEMLFSVKTSYLMKMADFPTAGKNADEIRNFFVHEGNHISRARSLGGIGWALLNKNNKYDVEKSAYQAQMNDPTWSRCSEKFKNQVIKSAFELYGIEL